MKRALLAVLSLVLISTLGGVAFAGYTVFETTQHAMAAMSAFKGKMPAFPSPSSQMPPGLKPPTSRSGSRQPATFPPFPVPGTTTAPRRGTPGTQTYTYPFPYPYPAPTAKPGRKHHRSTTYPNYPPAPAFPGFPPGRP